jgi:hypothetical protein
VVKGNNRGNAECGSGNVEGLVDFISSLAQSEVNTPGDDGETLEADYLLGSTFPGLDFAGAKSPGLRDGGSNSCRVKDIVAFDVAGVPRVHKSTVDQGNGGGDAPHNLVRFEAERTFFLHGGHGGIFGSLGDWVTHLQI